MLFNKHLKAASLGVALVVLATVSSAAAAQGNMEFGLGKPATIDDLPNGAFKNSLMALPPQASARALGILKNGEFPAADFEHMRVDPQGFLLYVDPLPEEGAEEVTGYPPPSNNTALDVLTLHSKPGSVNTLYVDFDGHILQGTVWNSGSGNAILDMLPFNVSGDPDTYTQDEVDRIAEAWRRVAEDFAPFDVDVTTEEPPYTTLSDGERYYGSTTAHALVTNRIDRFGNAAYNCSCGGVAYLNGWGNTNNGTNLNFNSGLTSNAMTISHETGHTLGLSHDGTTTSGYYSGHGSGATSWGPIMGAPFGKTVVTWSRDTYPNATNSQDDYLYIIDDIPFRTDDHTDMNLGAATPLQVTGGTNVVSQNRVNDPEMVVLANKGIIEDQNDIDVFSMNVQAGLINLSIEADTMATFTANQGADLDIEAKLLDAGGSVLQTSNPLSSLDATISYVGLGGTYYLAITGVEKAVDGSDPGYSDYGIVGQFYINGTVPADVEVTDPPDAPNDLSATVFDDDNIDLAWTDPVSLPSANEDGYRVFRSVDGAAFGLQASIAANSEFYSDNNLADGTYRYYVEVYNSVAPADQSNEVGPIVIDAPDVPTIAVATSETTASGTITSGSYLNTQVLAGSETLKETHQGGKKQNRRSFADHTWNVTDVAPGATVVLSVTGYAPGNSENDDFNLTYSVNGDQWFALGTLVNGGGSDTFMAALDPATIGSVRVRVVDSDPNTVGASNLDTVVINEIKIESGGEPGNFAPVVTITAPVDGTNVEKGTPLGFAGTANDTEDGDLTDGLSWSSNIQGILGNGGGIANVILSLGDHVVTASVDDAEGATGEDAINVTVYDPSGPTSMSVSELSGSGVAGSRGGKWNAVVTVTVLDNTTGAVSGATVNATWSNGTNGSGSCLTTGSGQCTITKNNLKSNVSSVTLTVTGVDGPLTYVDSGINSVGVNKP